MALDTKQDRMSVVNISSPWNGPLIDPAISDFTQENRQAAAYRYSGILAGEAVEPEPFIPYYNRMSIPIGVGL